MFSRTLEHTLDLAFGFAKDNRHEFVTVEHLLLALFNNTDEAEVLKVLRSRSESIEKLRVGLTIFINETTPLVEPGKEVTIQPTLSFQRVLQRAILQAQSAGMREVTGVHVLLAIFSEKESQAVYFLSQQGIDREDIAKYIASGISTQRDMLQSQAENTSDLEPITVSNQESCLERFAVNLNAQARLGALDPLIGRGPEIQRAIQVLCRRRKNNPLLVGEAGVGKTAIVDGLAQRLVMGNVPSILLGCTIYSLDLGLLLAGTKYRGDFEKRFKDVIKELQNTPGAIVFIDEIHTLIGAGAASGGTLDAANLLKPLLTSGNLKCMGSTTYDEYRMVFEKDSALSRRFQKIDVGEPSVEETYEILKGLRPRFESFHEVRYSLPALKAAAELAARYINGRRLPDKAIDVIDEAGAHYRSMSEHSARKNNNISRHDIEDVVSQLAHIPAQNVSSSDRTLLRDLDRNLKLLVFGQDEAIDTLCSAIKLARSGLREPHKPIGAFLLTGPTGVGKTEVTQQLAKALGIELIRFDMSEYMERHAVSRLIGAPPGYVGYEQAGLLTEAVIKQPHAVVLLDEIEKAHPDIYNILLQIMDYGTLTDNNGRVADFRHATLIMTSNAGAAEMERHKMGFVAPSTSSTYGEEATAIKQLFTPEFRNRLDSIISFKSLDRQTLARVVDKFIMELEVRLEAKGVTLNVDELAREWLAQHGYEPAMGARPMGRIIQEHIKKPLADELLFGKLVNGGRVDISAQEDKLKISVGKAVSKVRGDVENDA